MLKAKSRFVPPPKLPPPTPVVDVGDAEMRLAQDLLFFAYRDFTNVADQVLEELGLGRAHHRALHFIGRNPGITVSGLLAILRITKQSLARVLNALVDEGYRRPGARVRGPPAAAADPDGQGPGAGAAPVRRAAANSYRQAYRDSRARRRCRASGP